MIVCACIAADRAALLLDLVPPAPVAPAPALRCMRPHDTAMCVCVCVSLAGWLCGRVQDTKTLISAGANSLPVAVQYKQRMGVSCCAC